MIGLVGVFELGALLGAVLWMGWDGLIRRNDDGSRK